MTSEEIERQARLILGPLRSTFLVSAGPTPNTQRPCRAWFG